MKDISALMDGELDAGEAGRELTRIKQNADLHDDWETFHLIGDVMRGNPLLSPDFERRVARRLEQEPTVLAPRRHRIPPAVSYALSAAASLSAAAVVAWVALSGNLAGTGSGDAPGYAQVPPMAEVASAPPALANVPDDGRTHEYLLAHQGVSPSTALQGVAPYVRTVSVGPHSNGR